MLDLTTVTQRIVVPRVILFVAMASSCRSDATPVRRVANQSKVMARPVAADQQPRSRNFLGVAGRGDANYGTYLRLEGLTSGAMFDGLRWVRVCNLMRRDSTVSFTTAEMFGGAEVFEGVSDAD